MAAGLHVVVVPSWWPSAERPLHGVFFPDFCAALAEAGLKVGVVTPDLVGARHWLSSDAPWRPRVNWEGAGGVAVVRVRGRHTSLGRPGLHMRCYRRWLAAGLAAYRSRHGEPDVLHAMASLPAGWACTQLSDPLSRRVVITEHTGPFSLLLSPASAANMTFAALRAAADVAAVSAHLAESMRAAGVDRVIRLIGNAVGPAFVGSAPPPIGRDRAGRAVYRGAFVGRLVGEKGLRELAAAARRLAGEKTFVVQWDIVGTGPMAGELHAALGDAAATFHGYQDAAGVAAILRQAHFLALPSHGENFPLAICEALAAGRPVIASDVPGCAALVGPDDGVLARAGDAGDLADATRRLLSAYDRWDWQSISRRAGERFSRRRVADEYVQVYEAVVAEASAARGAVASAAAAVEDR
jgi:teichuronic acid biosynthesis glycosyltransferase TuaC